MPERGRLIYPVPHGFLSFISRIESAAVTIKAAEDPYYQNNVYTLTQKRACTINEPAAVLTESVLQTTGEPVCLNWKMSAKPTERPSPLPL